MSRRAWSLVTLFAVAALAVAPLSPAPAGADDKKPEIVTDLSALPPPVAAMREAILEAARSGDVEAMRTVLESNELMPNVSFGGVDDPIAFWKETSGDKEGREILAVLVNILQMPYARVRAGTSDEMYIWPYMNELDMSKLTPAEEVDLYRLMKPVEVKAMAEFGAYIWYRLGIGRDGTWHFFVAGD